MPENKILIDETAETVKKEGTNGEQSAKIDLSKIDIPKVKINLAEKPNDNLKPPDTPIFKDVDDFLKDYKDSGVITDLTGGEKTETTEPVKRTRRTRKKSVISGDILTGALFITLIDLVVPIAITTVNNTLTKDKSKHINYNDLRLKQTQKNELEPLADEIMKELQIKANPIFLFIAALLSIYGLNYVEARFTPKK